MRRSIQFLGWLMILAGLGFVAWFAWQYWGTNIVSEQKQQEILDDWENTDAVGILRVPRFGADYEVPIMPGSNLVDAKGDAALSRGVAWYELGEEPGDGNDAEAQGAQGRIVPVAVGDIARRQQRVDALEFDHADGAARAHIDDARQIAAWREP